MFVILLNYSVQSGLCATLPYYYIIALLYYYKLQCFYATKLP